MKVEKKLGRNSCMKYFRRLQKIILLCVKNRWLPNDPFIGYKLARKEVVANYLLMEEIDSVAKLDLPSAKLTLVRDVFLFSCYTGLAYADVKKLTYDEIQTGLDGHTWLFIQRQKLGTPAPVPLLPVCFDVLKKYKDHPKCRNTNLVFPVLSNQKMNLYLKDIAKLPGINKFLTYQLARHTFATSVTLNNDVPIESVSRMMGHKTLKQTQHYAKVLNKKVSDDMQILRLKMTRPANQDTRKQLLNHSIKVLWKLYKASKTKFMRSEASALC